jgi:hypothetical protein
MRENNALLLLTRVQKEKEVLHEQNIKLLKRNIDLRIANIKLQDRLDSNNTNVFVEMQLEIDKMKLIILSRPH